MLVLPLAQQFLTHGIVRTIKCYFGSHTPKNVEVEVNMCTLIHTLLSCV